MNKINKILADWRNEYSGKEKLTSEYSYLVSAAQSGGKKKADEYVLLQLLSRADYGIYREYYSKEMIDDAVLLGGHLDYEVFGTSVKDIEETVKYLGEILLNHGISKIAVYSEGYFYKGKRFNKCLQALQNYGWILSGCQVYTKPGNTVGDSFLVFEHEN